MSEWGIKLKSRKEVVQIRTILRTWKQHSQGLPAMEIVDTWRRKHTLTAVDFISYDWKKIKEGSRIEVEIGESIRNARVL